MMMNERRKVNTDPSQRSKQCMCRISPKNGMLRRARHTCGLIQDLHYQVLCSQISLIKAVV